MTILFFFYFLQNTETMFLTLFEDVGHSSDARTLLEDYLLGDVREEDRKPEFKDNGIKKQKSCSVM